MGCWGRNRGGYFRGRVFSGTVIVFPGRRFSSSSLRYTAKILSEKGPR
jgi:hypothetical protein